MNVIDANRLLVAATLQRERRLPITDGSERKELQEMAAAGLVEVTTQGTDAHPSICLERLTEPGRAFERAFLQGVPGATVPVAASERRSSERQADSCAAAIGKWQGKFAAMHLAEVH